MMFDPDKHHRRSIRLKDYDYSQDGAYFVTICAFQRACLFGEIVDGAMQLNGAGQIVLACWDALPRHYPQVILDAFVVMPNHVHAVIVLDSPNQPANAPALSEIIRAFKSFSSRRINDACQTPGTTIWQRSFYEHIIRTEQILDAIRQYIADNPINWPADTENPSHIES